jgi:hypothetical protein
MHTQLKTSHCLLHSTHIVQPSITTSVRSQHIETLNVADIRTLSMFKVPHTLLLRAAATNNHMHAKKINVHFFENRNSAFLWLDLPIKAHSTLLCTYQYGR